VQGYQEIINCLNCGKQLIAKDKFCSECGQKNIQPKIPFKVFISEFFQDYFTFDSRLLRSIIPLLIKPGYLTSQYTAGKRANFIPPLRVFIFTSIAFFIFFSLSTSNKGVIHIIDSLEESADSSAFQKDIPGEIEDYSVKVKVGGILGDPGEIRKAIKRMGTEAYIDSINPGASAIERYFTNKITQILISGDGKLNELFFRNSSKVVFLMLPLFAILLKLFYIRRKRFFFEHFIFSLHFHTFIFIFFLLIMLISEYIVDIPHFLSFLLIIVYFLFALKNVYLQAWSKTILKFSLILLSYILLFIPVFFIVTLLLSVIFFKA
jgi:hypothetical protein